MSYWVRANISAFDATKGGGRAAAIVSGKATPPHRKAAANAGEHLTHAEAIRKKENYLADLRELEYGSAVDRVVEVSEVIRQIAENYAAVRLRLSVIPSRVAARIAAADDADEVRALIEAEVIEALEDLSLGAGGFIRD